MKEDRQSSFSHIRRGFPRQREKNPPSHGNLFLSLLTSLPIGRVQEQEKNSILSIFRNKHGSTRPDALSERLFPLAHCV